MPTIFQLQSNFTSGELDIKLSARVNFAGYEKAAAKLRNVLVIPQGGLRRRFGTKFVTQISNIQNTDELKFVVLEFNLSPQYLMVFTPLLIRVFLVEDDKTVTEIFSLPSLYITTDIKDLKFTQTSNVLIIVHENHQPNLLRRVSAISGWNATTNTPALVSSVGTQGEAYNVTVAGNTILDGVGNWEVGEWVFFNLGVWTKLQPLPPNEPWELENAKFTYFPTFDFKQNYDDAIFIPNALEGLSRTLTITNPGTTSFRFSNSLEGGLFIGNGGTMRFTTIANPPTNTIMNGNIIQPFSGNLGMTPPPPTVVDILGKDSLLTEPAFSNLLGWPKSAAFFQGRLWFGGAKALPSGVFGSVVNDFFNFDTSQPVDSSGISIFINSDRATIVHYVVGAQSLIVFTSDGEYSTQVILEDAVTPDNFSMIQQTKNGAANVQPLDSDNQVIFVDRSGQIIRNLIYDSSQGRYVAENISILSGQLVNNPVSSAIYKGNSRDDSVYLFFINEDGTLLAYQTLISQSISAFTLGNTQGNFKQTTGATNNAFFLVDREGRFFIEQLEFDLLLDAATVFKFDPPNNLLTGLAHFNNRLVRVIADNIILDPLPVVGDVLQLPFAATDVTIGLDFTSIIETLPINVETQTGPNLYLPKKIKRVFIDFFESLGIEVDGIMLEDLKFSATDFKVPPPPRTGFAQLFIDKGYESAAQVVIVSQQFPLPMTIRAISFEVDINA